MAIGAGRDDLEAQQRRGDRLEVAGVGEEREDLLRACRARSCSRLQDVDAHASATGVRSMRRAWATSRSAPVPPLRADDHVRGAAARPLRRPLRRLHVPALRASPRERLRGGAASASPSATSRCRPRTRAPCALAHAAEAAARQGAFWPFHDALYADQGRIDDPHLWARCERLGLDVDRFEADRRVRRGRRARRAATCATALRAGRPRATPDASSGAEGAAEPERALRWIGFGYREAADSTARRSDGRATEGR